MRRGFRKKQTLKNYVITKHESKTLFQCEVCKKVIHNQRLFGRAHEYAHWRETISV